VCNTRPGWSYQSVIESVDQSINQTIVCPKVDQRAGQLGLPHVGITKTETIEVKSKTDEQISPVNGLTDRNRLRWRIRFSEKVVIELRVKQ